MKELIRDILAKLSPAKEELQHGAIAIADGYGIDDRFVDPKKTKFSNMVDVGVSESVVEIAHFVELVNEYKVNGTKVLYANNQVVARLDFAVKDGENSKDYLKIKPLEREYYEFKTNQISLKLQSTKESLDFKNLLEKTMSQKEMINTLKRYAPFMVGNERLIDILGSLNLQSDNKFETTNTSESTSISRVVTVAGKAQNAKTEIPTKLTFKLPFYENDLNLTTKEVEVELTIDTSNSNLGFKMQSFQFDRVEKLAGEEIVAKLKTDLKDLNFYRVDKL